MNVGVPHPVNREISRQRSTLHRARVIAFLTAPLDAASHPTLGHQLKLPGDVLHLCANDNSDGGADRQPHTGAVSGSHHNADRGADRQPNHCPDRGTHGCPDSAAFRGTDDGPDGVAYCWADGKPLGSADWSADLRANLGSDC